MVCFVDVGYSSMQVSVVAFKKGQLKVGPKADAKNSLSLRTNTWILETLKSKPKSQIQVMSHVCDRAFGGKDLDEMIFQHFADEFKSKYKVDARTEQKASLRLKMQVNPKPET